MGKLRVRPFRTRPTLWTQHTVPFRDGNVRATGRVPESDSRMIEGRRRALGRLLLFQRVIGAGVERLDLLVPQTALIDLDAGSEQLRLRQLFDGKADRVGRTVEAAILHLARHL